MRKLIFVALAAMLLLGGCFSTYSPSTTVQEDESRKIAAENANVRTTAYEASDPATVPDWCRDVTVNYGERFSGNQSSVSPGYSNRILAGKNCQKERLVREAPDVPGWGYGAKKK